MQKLSFGGVRTIIGETNAELRTSLQAAFFGHGMREIVMCKGADTLFPALQREVIDLLVCDYDLPGIELGELTRQIRNGVIARNPFMQIIAIMADSSIEPIRRVIEAGVDDVVRKPVSINQLLARLRVLISNRRPFACTENYFGPSLRGKGYEGTDEEDLMAVPNTLRSRVVEGANGDQVEQLVESAIIEMKDRRSMQALMGLGRTVGQALADYEAGGHPDAFRRTLDRVVPLAEDTARRYRARGKSAASLAEIALGLAVVVRRLARGESGPQRSDVERLTHYAELIGKTRNAYLASRPSPLPQGESSVRDTE